jgi:Na+/melibiose symporter-like transporter
LPPPPHSPPQVPFFFALLKVKTLNTTLLMACAGAVAGITHSPNDMVEHVLIGWVIDEDGVKHKGLRREGMFWACNGVCQHLSEVVIALVLASFSWAGFDPKLCASDQPGTAVAAIEYSFLLGGPVVLLGISLLAYLYPIRGARLAKLKADVAAMEVKRRARMAGRNTERGEVALSIVKEGPGEGREVRLALPTTRPFPHSACSLACPTTRPVRPGRLA